MTRFVVQDRHQEIGDLLRAAGKKGVVVETKGRPSHAFLPLNDRVLDLLLETSPRLIAECAKIRKEMAAGKYYTQDEVDQILGLGTSVRKGNRTTARRSRNARGA
jgi:hypothetical protein